MTASMNYSQVLNQVLRQGDMTLNPNNMKAYTGDGYGVAKNRRHEVKLSLSGDSGELQGHFNAILADIRFKAASMGCYIGLWIDSGILYFDVTEVIHSRDRAIKVGYMRKQLAIWDFKAMQAIETTRKAV